MIGDGTTAMLRQIHSLPGLIAAILVAVLAITGAILSLDPVLERAGATLPKSGRSAWRRWPRR